MKLNSCEIINNDQGFTLIEVLIAVVIFTIGILSVNAMQTTSILGNSKASRITESATWATDKVEYLMGLDYDHSDLDDVDGDGTDQDLDGDSVDDNDGVDSGVDADDNGIDDDDNFGLDHVSAAMADGHETSSDGKYEIYWNVAVDTPLEGIKKIKVIVIRIDRGVKHAVTINYMKSDSV